MLFLVKIVLILCNSVFQDQKRKGSGRRIEVTTMSAEADRLSAIEAKLDEILSRLDGQRQPTNFVAFQDKMAAITEAYRSGDKRRLKEVQKQM